MDSDAGSNPTDRMWGSLVKLHVPLRHSGVRWGRAYASVGAALPEVARKGCPRDQSDKGFCARFDDQKAKGGLLFMPWYLALAGST